MEKWNNYMTGDITARFPDLAGKTAVISGASHGIGCGIADFLGRQGVMLVLTARSEQKGKDFIRRLNKRNIDAIWVTSDLSDYAQAEIVFNAALEKFGKVDILINNAASVGMTVSFLDLNREQYKGFFEDNVRMVYGLSYHAARHMAGRKQGSIINISSVGGLRVHRGKSGYDASKGAIDTLTRAMAVDLAPYGVRVNAIAPGATLSFAVTPENESIVAEKAKGIPLGRMATCEEIGAAAAFLASDAGAYITGQVIYVDGGLTAQLTPPGIFV